MNAFRELIDRIQWLIGGTVFFFGTLAHPVFGYDFDRSTSIMVGGLGLAFMAHCRMQRAQHTAETGR